MRIRMLLLAAVLATTTVAGCSGDDGNGSGSAPATAHPATGPEALPVGKSPLSLADGKQYLSPAGFAPRLRIEIPGEGWNSTHRGADGFDIGQPVPGVDAALVVVAFLTPAEDTAEAALQAVTEAARAAGARVTGSDSLQVTGGDGPLVQSRDAGIALDAVPTGASTVTATDTDEGPLLSVTWVPDSANLAQAQQLSAALLAQVAQD